MPLHVSSACAHHQEVKIALHSLWYHHTYRWPSRAPVHEMATGTHGQQNVKIILKYCTENKCRPMFIVTARVVMFCCRLQ